MGWIKKILILLAIWVVLLVGAVIVNFSVGAEQSVNADAFHNICKRGFIRVGIFQNTNDYYVENGTVKGFHYELVELFASKYNLKAKYIVYNTYWEAFCGLKTDKVDFLAMDLNSNFWNNMFLLFTHPHSYSSHVLLQRKDNLLIDKNFNILPNKDKSKRKPVLLSVDGLSDFYEDALRLSVGLDTLCIELSIQEMPNTEDLLDLLNKKETDMIIANLKVMKSNVVFYPKIDYSVKLTDELPLHWAVNKNNTSLHKRLNHWLDSLKKKRHYSGLLEKYYLSTSKPKQYQSILSDNAISFYDAVIKKYAVIYNLDWRLVAAIIYQESKFNPTVRGKGGAYGLMQIMPVTAAHLGIKDSSSIESQIGYGCKYLQSLKKKYAQKGVDATDLYKFILAAYNAGSCHIDDAQVLAKKKGYNPNQWKDVERMLLNLSSKSYTRNVPLNCGNYKGKQAVNYVSKVWNIYLHYKNAIG